MITLEFINKRTMLYVDEKVNFYDYDLDVYEELLREFKDDLIKQALPPTIFLIQELFCVRNMFRKENFVQLKFLFLLMIKKKFR